MKTITKIGCIGALVAALASCGKTEQPEFKELVPTGSISYRRDSQESLTEFKYSEDYEVRFNDGTVGIRKFEIPLHSKSEHVKMYGHEGSDDYEIFRRKGASTIETEAELLKSAAKNGIAVKVYGTKDAAGKIEIKKIE